MVVRGLLQRTLTLHKEVCFVEQRVVLGLNRQVREKRVTIRPPGSPFDPRDTWWLRRPRPPEVTEPKRHGRVSQRFTRHPVSKGHVYAYWPVNHKK